MSTQFISTNKNYKRLFNAPLDNTLVWESESELREYLSNPTSYKNQIVGCNGKAYIIYDNNGVLDLKEIGNDINLEDLELDTYVKKEEGKSLSSNDYTDEDKLLVGRVTEINEAVSNINTVLDNINTNTVRIPIIEQLLNEHSSKLDKLLYEPLVINSFTLTKTAGEIGEVIPSLQLRWSFNKDVTEQKLDSSIIANDIRTIIKNEISSNTTFKLEATDGTTVATKSVSINFYNGKYYGVSSSEVYDSNLILSLNKNLTNSRNGTHTVNCGVGQYIYFAIPSRMGVPTFTVGAFSGGFNKVATIDFTNQYKYTESYDIWKSSNSNLGNTTFVVT